MLPAALTAKSGDDQYQSAGGACSDQKCGAGVVNSMPTRLNPA
jgi:hypothetical protein